LISYPVKIDMSGLKFRSPADRLFVDRLLNDKEQFVKSYIKDNSFQSYLKGARHF